MTRPRYDGGDLGRRRLTAVFEQEDEQLCRETWRTAQVCLWGILALLAIEWLWSPLSF